MKYLRSVVGRAMFVVACAVLALAGSLAAPATAGGETGTFSVIGTQIVGPDGLVFTPRGVNKSGLEYSSYGYDLSFNTFKAIKAWGANFVRVPLSPSFALARMCTYDRNYMKRVDRIVGWAEQLHMLVLLDDHMSTGGLTCGIGRWADLRKAPDLHNSDFVKLLAARYRNRPWVAIDLFNEPHGITNGVWRNGGVVDGYRAVGMQRLLDVVRATGNRNLVFASGNNWANDLGMVASKPLQNDRNVVYGAHSYPISCGHAVVRPDQPYSCNGKQYPPFLDTRVAPALQHRAVVITEFGTQRSIPGEMQAPIDWAEAHHVGWAAWLWSRGTISNFCLLDQNGNPSVSGQPVRDSLARAFWL